MQARRAELIVKYNGVDISADLAESVIDFTYTDAYAGELDDLQLTLEDRFRKWQGPWSPQEGDQIVAEIVLRNWKESGDELQFPCGTFYVDSGSCSGPPDIVSIRAVSLPVDSEIRQERRSKAWEKISLWTIAQEIANTAGLDLQFYATDNPNYDREDQDDESDLSFLADLMRDEGIAAKITGDQLILFDESFFESRDAVLTLTRGEDWILDFAFEWSLTDVAYRACEVRYKDSKSDKMLKATYTPPGAPEMGPILRIRESVDSEAEALRIARKRLRERNKQAGKGTLSLVGDVRLAAGMTINIAGWGRFDGKYLIERARHKVGNDGYTTGIDIRKVLGW
ncbi:phage late control D family protein [Paenibacillus contaminans]|uniref:Late control protein n=1 Tax=Paenibacillus contaminans TaxID=450362 RepID=A0A329MFZ1_9BACL|nr:contractile injection system protein, VgrG/Pvc8 family [Paenibacillus contaminans]RAV18835.1 late control protein [Paenibacillus contaminans]